jgi:thiol-disulfide isomerase/thioredoxin
MLNSKATVRTIGVLMLAAMAAGASAADRKVLCEDFTATWCGPCKYAARAMNRLMNEFPDTFLGLQVHQDDNYTKGWGNRRASYYSIQGYPTLWFDGKVKQYGIPGSDDSAYSALKSKYDNRMKVSTDVTVEVGVKEVDEDTVTVSVRVTLDAEGAAKDVRVFTVQALDHYPDKDSGHRQYQYRNCLMKAAVDAGEDISLSPGESWEKSYEMNIDFGRSGEQKGIEEVVYLAWAQKKASNGSSGQGEVFNVGQMGYPFEDLPPPPPPPFEKGDMNCDGEINFDDVDPFVIAITSQSTYLENYPDCNWMLGDIDGDGDVTFNDVDGFVDCLVNGGCPR